MLLAVGPGVKARKLLMCGAYIAPKVREAWLNTSGGVEISQKASGSCGGGRGSISLNCLVFLVSCNWRLGKWQIVITLCATLSAMAWIGEVTEVQVI